MWGSLEQVGEMDLCANSPFFRHRAERSFCARVLEGNMPVLLQGEEEETERQDGAEESDSKTEVRTWRLSN